MCIPVPDIFFCQNKTNEKTPKTQLLFLQLLFQTLQDVLTNVDALFER